MLPNIRLDDSEDIPVHQLRWVRQSNCMDRLLLWVPRNVVPENVTVLQLNLTWHDREIPWVYCGTANETFGENNGGQWLVGNIITPERKEQLEQSEDKFSIYQVSSDGKADGWVKLLQRVAGECEDNLRDKIAHISEVLPHPVVFIRPPGWTASRFLTQLVSTVQYNVPQIVGWHFRCTSFLFALGTGEEENLQDDEWKLKSVRYDGNDNLSHVFEKCVDADSISAHTLECFLEKGIREQRTGIIEEHGASISFPEAKIYKHNGQKLYFHRFEAIYPSLTRDLRIKLELRVQPAMQAPVLPLLAAQGEFQGRNKDGTLWEIKLADANIKEGTVIFAYPRLPFTGGRGVFVKPEGGDNVLVTIPHGGVPTAAFLAQKNDKAEENDVTIFGNTSIQGETTIEKDTTIKGNVKVGG